MRKSMKEVPKPEQNKEDVCIFKFTCQSFVVFNMYLMYLQLSEPDGKLQVERKETRRMKTKMLKTKNGGNGIIHIEYIRNELAISFWKVQPIRIERRKRTDIFLCVAPTVDKQAIILCVNVI